MDLHSCCFDIVLARDQRVIYEAPLPIYLLLQFDPMYPLGERLPTSARLSRYYTPCLYLCLAGAEVHAILLVLWPLHATQVLYSSLWHCIPGLERIYKEGHSQSARVEAAQAYIV